MRNGSRRELRPQEPVRRILSSLTATSFLDANRESGFSGSRGSGKPGGSVGDVPVSVSPARVDPEPLKSPEEPEDLEGRAFETAREKDSPSGYDSFAAAYPASKRLGEVKALRAQSLWNVACDGAESIDMYGESTPGRPHSAVRICLSRLEGEADIRMRSGDVHVTTRGGRKVAATACAIVRMEAGVSAHAVGYTIRPTMTFPRFGASSWQFGPVFSGAYEMSVLSGGGFGPAEGGNHPDDDAMVAVSMDVSQAIENRALLPDCPLESESMPILQVDRTLDGGHDSKVLLLGFRSSEKLRKLATYGGSHYTVGFGQNVPKTTEGAVAIAYPEGGAATLIFVFQEEADELESLTLMRRTVAVR